jgi:Transposase IS116/IS110/IS902 family/GAF domain
MKTRRRNIPKVKRRKEPTAARRHGPAAASLEKQLDQRTRELAATKKQLTEPRDAGAVQPDKGLVDQRASSELLSVISRPSGELEPAFETLLANVTRLCQGKFGILHLREGEGFRMAAVHGAPPAYVEYRKRQPVIGVREFPHLPLARVARTKAVQHLPDLTRDRAYVDRDPLMVTLVESCGARSLLCIPMLKEEDLIGAIVIYYGDPRPLDQDQIALAKNFASRAVTAIESAHRLKESFRSGRDFAAWIGLVPRQDSTGGKQKLGPISKKGDRYLRRILVVGAHSVLRRAKQNPEKYPWLTQLLARRPFKVVAIALANKMARVAWALLARGGTYRVPALAAA